MLAANAKGVFPYTPATNLLYGLREALAMLHEQGLEQVFARHDRHAEATRRAVRAWGLEVLCQDPREYSSSLTAVLMPDGQDADALRRLILERFDLSLGNGLGRLAGRVFRIGHLGDFNDLMLAGTLAGIEMGLQPSGLPRRRERRRRSARLSGASATQRRRAGRAPPERPRPPAAGMTPAGAGAAARPAGGARAVWSARSAPAARSRRSTAWRRRICWSARARIGLTCTVSMGPPPRSLPAERLVAAPEALAARGARARRAAIGCSPTPSRPPSPAGSAACPAS